MDLKNFQKIINEVVSEIEENKGIPTAGTEKGPKHIPVEIVLSEPSIGPRSTAEIDCVGLGFDWDAGKLLLTPSEELVRKAYGGGTSRMIESNIDGKIVYSCSGCYIICDKSDKYCRNCGKRFRNKIKR